MAKTAISEFRKNGERTHAISSLASAGKQTSTAAEDRCGRWRWRLHRLRSLRQSGGKTRHRRCAHHATDAGRRITLDELADGRPDRSEERHRGKEWVRECEYWWSPYYSNTNSNKESKIL